MLFFLHLGLQPGGIIKYIDEKKINVPKELKILSFDDYPFTKYLKYPLITIKQDTENMGKYGFQAIFKLINKEKVSSMRLKTKLIIY